MLAENLAQQIRIPGIVFAPRGIPSLAIFGQRQRMYRIEVQLAVFAEHGHQRTPLLF
jgi:hypothetical protein